MSRYTLSDFNNILENNIFNQLPEDTIKIINNLAIKVGAPEYIKTPQFKNRQEIPIGMDNSIRRKKKTTELFNDDWKTIKTFQATEFKKKEGIENNIHLIRKYLNMITKNTYLKLKTDIITEINIVNSTNNNDLNYLCNEIFKIIIYNTLYSDIYAKLYKDLIAEFDIFNDILFENFENFELLFSTIEYFDPEKDYDKFCENNKNNEKRRSTCFFYINLMKENIIDHNIIGTIILNLFNKLDQMIIDEKKNELDELSELLYIIITNSYEKLNLMNKNIAIEIYNNVVKITKMKSKNEPGITNKCIFKHMDILDEISD